MEIIAYAQCKNCRVNYLPENGAYGLCSRCAETVPDKSARIEDKDGNVVSIGDRIELFNRDDWTVSFKNGSYGLHAFYRIDWDAIERAARWTSARDESNDDIRFIRDDHFISFREIINAFGSEKSEDSHYPKIALMKMKTEKEEEDSDDWDCD